MPGIALGDKDTIVNKIEKNSWASKTLSSGGQDRK